MNQETTPPWKLITPEQLKQGWMELRGITPIHHEFLVIEKIGDNYKVRNPESWMLEHPVEREK